MIIVPFVRTRWKQVKRHGRYSPVVTAFIVNVSINGLKATFNALHADMMCENPNDGPLNDEYHDALYGDALCAERAFFFGDHLAY